MYHLDYTLLSSSLLRPGPIYQLDCGYSFQPDRRRLISHVQISGLCLILRPDCGRAAKLHKPILGRGPSGNAILTPGLLPGPTIGSLIFNISCFTTRRISRRNAPDCCCNPRSHILTDYDPTKLLSRVGVWDRAFSPTHSLVRHTCISLQQPLSD